MGTPAAFMVASSNMIDAFFLSNLFGKGIVIGLFLGSIVVWAIMMTKGSQLRRAASVSRTFLRAYRDERDPAALMRKQRTYRSSPLYMVYRSAAGELLEQLGESADVPALTPGTGSLTPAQYRAVQSAVERAAADQGLVLESSMGWLASATTSAPFLGLLGTVMGVMDSFGGMAVARSVMLSEVAPGISAALLTTVVGLIVAIPSAIGYNHLTTRIRELCVQLENFGDEFLSDVELSYGESRNRGGGYAA